MDTLTRMRALIDVVEAECFSAPGRKIGRSKALLSKYVREIKGFIDEVDGEECNGRRSNIRPAR